MVKIHGLVYIIIGGVMAFFSNFVYQKTNKTSLLLFFYFGLLFIAIGFFKIVKNFMLKDGAPKNDKKNMNPRIAAMLNKDLGSINMSQKQSISQSQNIIACPRCGTKHYSTSNFCHKCGYPLKKNI